MLRSVCVYSTHSGVSLAAVGQRTVSGGRQFSAMHYYRAYGLTLPNFIDIGRAVSCAGQVVLRWATVSEFSSRCRTLISVCNQPATQGQLSLPSLRGR